MLIIKDIMKMIRGQQNIVVLLLILLDFYTQICYHYRQKV